MGKLIVLEGTDGSGKSTQFKRLCSELKEEHIPFFQLVFPRYDKPSAALIKLYLNGNFGSHPSDVNAYAASSFFSVDRYASWKEEWQSVYNQPDSLILSDRYTTSNAVHQGSKLTGEDQKEFLRWLFDFEYNKLGLPKPDRIIYLDMPTDSSIALLREREAETHHKGDIHETDTAYLRLCRQTALTCCDLYHWEKVSCTDATGQIRREEEIGNDIRKIISEVVPVLVRNAEKE